MNNHYVTFLISFQARIETRELEEQLVKKEQFSKDLKSTKGGSDDMKIDKLIAGYLQTRNNDHRKGSISKNNPIKH